jgi:uncharacterized protein
MTDPPDASRVSPDSSDDRALVHEVRTTASLQEPSFSIALDEPAQTFVASQDGVELGWVVFTEKDDNVILRATSILPAFRGMGYATALTRRVLDLLYDERKHVTVVCPVFRSFVEQHPEYGSRLGLDVEDES